MMTQSQQYQASESQNINRPHREMGVQQAFAIEPPSCDGGYWVLRFACLLLFATLSYPAFAQEDTDQPAIELSPLVKALLEDDLLTDTQRREAMIFHGQWEELGEVTGSDRIRLTVAKYPSSIEAGEGSAEIIKAIFEAQVLNNDSIYLISYASLNAGEPKHTLRIAKDFDIETGTPAWRVLFAKALEDMGQYPKAIEQLRSIREQVVEDEASLVTAADLTAAAQAVLMLARLEGRPAADFHLANKLLSKARDEVDPLYWPAYVAEARLLYDKGTPQEASEALNQALSLNPKSSEAWHLLGTLQTRYFNFDAGNQAVEQLRKINPEHPLADDLALQIALKQKDIRTAQEVLAPAIQRYPTHRRLMALSAAVHALAYDEQKKNEALQAFAELAPNNPLAEYTVGQAYANARQYALSEPHLKRAIAMMPGWSAPQLALGEMYMQWGKLKEAAEQLQAASSLDPFHKHINNTQLVASEMLAYDTIETDQFLVRYLPGIDEVLARDVALHMGDMVEQFIERFQHDPPAITQVDLMPDDQHFAVRITGMPDIWTIAACTGDVIAMTPPRPGPKRAYGPYNWLNVMGHEYAHVVNLSQTNNRVPHWFTEGCAVQMETTGRIWEQYKLLADCYNNDRLFEYDEINWGFIRPTEPYHRSLAYAQSAWIMEYIETTFGWGKALAMLDRYQQGTGEHETIQQVFGTDVESFMASFMDWAGEQVHAWGMQDYGKDIEDADLKDLLTTQDVTRIDQARLDQAFAIHGNKPALLKIVAQRALLSENGPAAIEAVKNYQTACPVDPWSVRQLVRLTLDAGDRAAGIESLKTLDKIEGNTPQYAVSLSQFYRQSKDYESALHYAERALLREPYNATYREMAATIAIQHADLSRAAFHVESLALLEPTRVVHLKRLAVLYDRLDRKEDAEAMRERIKSLELLDE